MNSLIKISYKNRSENPSTWEKVKQQTLPSWQPIYSTKTVSPIFLGLGITLIPLGVMVFILSKNTQEIKIDYTNCKNSAGIECATVIKPRTAGESCICKVNFEIKEPLQGKLHMYYELTNFYQNHRQYVDSRDNRQLLGEIGTVDNVIPPSNDCKPLAKNSQGQYYFPCGATANSMFNDSIKVFYNRNNEDEEVKLIRTGIAWESDRKYKFKNPQQFSNPKDPIWSFFVKPKDWSINIWELDPGNHENNGLQNEDLIVWMRISALPTLRKLYRIINSTSIGWEDGLGLPAGKYHFEINYNFEVLSFGGTKSIVLTELAFFGEPNSFLGIVLMTCGSIILAIGILFLLITVCTKQKTWERSVIIRDYGTSGSTDGQLSLRPKLA